MTRDASWVLLSVSYPVSDSWYRRGFEVTWLSVKMSKDYMRYLAVQVINESKIVSLNFNTGLQILMFTPVYLPDAKQRT